MNPATPSPKLIAKWCLKASVVTASLAAFVSSAIGQQPVNDLRKPVEQILRKTSKTPKQQGPPKRAQNIDSNNWAQTEQPPQHIQKISNEASSTQINSRAAAANLSSVTNLQQDSDQQPLQSGETSIDIQDNDLLDDETLDDDLLGDAGLQDDDDSTTELATTRYEMSLLSRPLALVEVDIRDFSDERPEDKSSQLTMAGYGSAYPRYFSPTAVYWRAADIGYQNLYFEDVLSERYGLTAPQYLQPYVSAAHFFGSAAVLPLNLLLEDADCCDYPYGYCLPGGCCPNPPLRQRLIED